MLKRDGGAYSVSGGAENEERLVPTDLDESAARAVDDVLDDLGEGGSKASGRLVSVFLGVAGVTTDVGNQEGSDSGFCRMCVGLFGVHGRSARGRHIFRRDVRAVNLPPVFERHVAVPALQRPTLAA
jgi:hypothetical protein